MLILFKFSFYLRNIFNETPILPEYLVFVTIFFYSFCYCYKPLNRWVVIIIILDLNIGIQKQYPVYNQVFQLSFHQALWVITEVIMRQCLWQYSIKKRQMFLNLPKYNIASDETAFKSSLWKDFLLTLKQICFLLEDLMKPKIVDTRYLLI